MKALIITCRILFAVFVVWGVFDFGLGTLSDIIVGYFGVPFTWAAVIVSVLVGIFGGISVFRVRKGSDNDRP